MKQRDYRLLLKKVTATVLAATMTLSLFVTCDVTGQFMDSIRTVFADETEDQDTVLEWREVQAEGEDIVVSGLLPSDVVVTAERVDVDISGANVIAAYDIKVFDKDGNEWQPSEPLKISVTSGEVSPDDTQVIYVPDELAASGAPVDIEDESIEKIDAVVTDGNVEFEAEHFSVYVIIEHEGGDVVTPRVQFHFISPVSENYEPVNNEGIYYYSSSPYEFSNKADDPLAGNKQVSMIVCDGDKLESIEAPLNTQSTYFYGWYTVEKSADTVTYDPSNNTYSGIITYSWSVTDPARVELDKTVTISEVRDSDNSITAINWTVGSVSGTSTDVDSEGCAHVYLAPIYSNYYFVNFHLGVRGETTAETLLSRKLIVIGNSNHTDVKVSDIKAPSNDPVHVVFIGWEENTGTEQDPEWTLIRTIDSHNQEIIDPGKDGKYITVGAKTVDLYPFFVQARYINFNIGASGNGALFLGPQLVFTSDEAQGDEYALTTLPTTTRNGYSFGGWYTGPDGTGYQVTDGSGNILNAQNFSVGNPMEYEVTGGKIKVYDALDELEFYAYWIPNQTTTYKVVIWKQKVTDAADATTKTYDYYTYFERDFDYVSNGNSYIVSTTAADRNFATTNPNGDFTGFQLGSYDAATEVDAQGSTVLNVYYDRITYNLKFIFARRQVNNNGTETGNFLVPTLNSTFYPPATITWQSYCTGGSGINWDNSGTTQLSAICSYNNALIGSEVYSGYRYYYYVITANYGADVSDVWPAYSYFPNNNRYLSGWWLMANSGLYGSAGHNDTVKGVVSIMNENILGYTGSSDGNFLIASYRTNRPNNWTYNIYFETLDGVDYSQATVVTRNGRTFYLADSFTARSSNTDITQQSAPAYTGFKSIDRVNSSTNNNYAADFYYSRNSYDFTFSANYPDSLAVNEPEPQVFADIPYEQSLASYSNTAAPAAPNSDYYFDGWYEDASGIVPFVFANETMPDPGKIVYAKWSLVEYPINVNPNGGVIDHIDYTWFTSAQLDAMGLDPLEKNGYATYFDNAATQTIESYDNLERNYVEVSDAEAAQMDPDDVYRYVYIYRSNQEGGQGKLGADARNAVYIRDTEASLSAFYDYYVYQVGLRQARDPELTALPRAQWEATYVSTEKYRGLRSGEQYVFLAWYEVVDGVRQNTPYDFSQPASHETTLVAGWRLDGGYSILYTTEYYADNNDYITANLEDWTDPLDGTSKYSDGAKTQAMQEPASVMVNGVGPEDSGYVDYQFLGWQIVMVETIAGKPRYTPLEPGVYYTAGQDLTVKAAYSDANMVIHMQAVYQRRDEAYRRPDVIGLTIDASKDAQNVGTGYIDSSISSLPVWTWPGHYWSDGTCIYFGDNQSNTAVHLYRYATTLTESEVTGEQLDPAGINVFKHTEGYILIGFDLDSPDTDFIPDFPADAVISVSPGEEHTLYAVWEPAVYMTIKNDTGVGPVTFKINGTDQIIRVVNQADGSFSRIALNPNQSITLADGESIKLVIPYGEGEQITISGTNTLGTGYWLTADSKLGITNPVSRTLTGNYNRIPNNEDFSFTDQGLVIDPEGVVITFTAEKAPHTLILDDNYTGGATREIMFSETTDGVVYYQNVGTTSYDLPSTSTRIGWELIGWDEDKDLDPATSTPAYTTGNWTISDLTAFFQSSTDGDKTLYAIWSANAEASTVYVWKDVPAPGDQTEDFIFTVMFSGSFSYTNSQRRGGRYQWGNPTTGTISSNTAQSTPNLSGSFTLKHNQYLKIVTEQNQTVDRPYLKMTVSKWQKNTNGDPDTKIGNDTVLSWYWQNTVSANPDNGKFGNFSFQNLQLSVTENDYTSRYDLGMEVAAYTTNAVLTTDDANRRLTWNDTYAGGTVIYTNTRKTADVTVSKVLLPDTMDPENFTFDAEVILPAGEDISYTLDPDSMAITSGADEDNGGVWKIKGIPTGSTLIITERDEDERFTTVANGTLVSDGSSVTDTDADEKVFKFEVNDDTEVIFTNTPITRNIRLVVVDDDVPFNYLDSANFTFPGVFEGTKFSASGTGLVWEGEVYVGQYVLTETAMPDHAGVRYTKLQAPVDIEILGGTGTGGKVVANVNDISDNVSVSYDSGTDTYTITVVNPKMHRITVKKTISNDYGINSFLFTATLTDSNGDPVQLSNVYGTSGTNDQGKLEFTLVNNQTALLYVPRNTNVEITETTDDRYITTYKTGDDQDHLGSETDGTSLTLSAVTTDKYVLFTNIRQKVDVTVEKEVDGRGGDFTFTAQLKQDNAAVPNYTLTDNGTPDDTSDDIITDSNGVAEFTLSPVTDGTDSIVFTVHKGMKINITEDTDAAAHYDTRYEVTSDGDVLAGDNSNTTGFISANTDITITFTNKEASVVAPTDVKDDSRIRLILMISSTACLAGVMIQGLWKKKRRADKNKV
ncbi:MAG: InlB B-repeat-containing protein [Clostridiales bacterium]|nr:InlB B-repeat-containing protein [Clostridiales bacterium]